MKQLMNGFLEAENTFGIGMPGERTGLYVEMVKSINSGWIHFGNSGTEKFPWSDDDRGVRARASQARIRSDRERSRKRAASKCRRQAKLIASRWPNCIPGEQSAEVHHIQNIVQVLRVSLKPHLQPLRLVKIGPG